jgi:D-arginine dehydrogenase
VPSTADVVVIGAGLAGAATAYALTRLGARKVAILEQEPWPAGHASGRNAAIVRQVAVSPDLLPLLAEGARFIAQPPWVEADAPRFDRRGSLLLGAGGDLRSLRTAARSLRAERVPTTWLSHEDVVGRLPITRGGAFEGAVATATDGVVDVKALVDGYLREAVAGGARLRLGSRVTAIETRKGAVESVRTAAESFATPTVVNAAGAWCGGVARLAGALSVPARPFRRHLSIAWPSAAVQPDWPVVWDVTHDFYFRPESGGLLLSACDQTECAPGEPPTDPEIVAALADKLIRFMPLLSEISIRRTWAGLRTLTSDGRFVIGADPLVKGFIWCAGLGGHGVTASAAVGRLAAQAALGGEVPAAHHPDRFVRRQASA